MSRDGGFDIGDRSTRTLYDTKLIRAYRIAGPEVIVAWDAIVDESWAKGQRVAIEDALLPLPYQLDIEAVKDALVKVGLLDPVGCIRQESWEQWFVPADERRTSKRERDREYAKRAARARWVDDSTSDRQRVASESVTARMPPTVRPADRPDRPSDNPSSARATADSPEGSSVASQGEHPDRLPEPPGLLSIEEGQQRMAAIRAQLGGSR